MDTELLIEWDEQKNMGIPLIDNQHKGIISIVNSLQFFLHNAEAEYYLTTTMNIINSYTKIHFATEEELMLRAQYKGYAGHKAIHEKMVKEAYAEANKSLRLSDPKMYLDFLRSWWITHTNEYDVDYIESMQRYFATQKSAAARPAKARG